MPKKSKISTPEWILEGYNSLSEYAKAKSKKPQKKNSSRIFKIKQCPECKSDDVKIVLSGKDSEQGGGKEWKCNKCSWTGENIQEKELTEDEFMKYLDDKGEGVA